MQEKAVLVFDLDGTLSDPGEGIWRCLNYALASFDLDVITRKEVAQFIGPPIDETFKVLAPLLDDSGIRAIVAKYRERYAAAGYRENQLYPGIKEALDALTQNRIPMAVCTSKREDFAVQILEMFGIRDHFLFVSGGDVGIRKTAQLQQLAEKNLLSDRAIMIGDRAVDITAALDNRLTAVGVLWGYGSKEELTEAGAQQLLSAPQDFQTLQATGS